MRFGRQGQTVSQSTNGGKFSTYFALKLLQPNDSTDKLDLLLVQKVFVLSLRVFDKEAHRIVPWVE